MRNEDEAILANPFLNRCHGSTSLPDDALFACAYDLNTVVDTFLEAVFFRRTGGNDELWILEDSDLDFVEEIACGTGPEQVLRPPSVCHPAPPSSCRPALDAGSTTLRCHAGLDPASTAPAERGRNTRRLYAGCAYIVPARDTEAVSCESLLGRLFFSRAGHYWPRGFILGGIIDEAAYCRIKAEVERELDENTDKARQTETEIIKVAEQLGLSPRPTGTDSRFWYANCPGKGHPLEIKAEANLFYCGYCRRKGSIEELRILVSERRKH